MKRFRQLRRVIPFAGFLLSAGFAGSSAAHVGSPNVVFDGQAGPNPVRIVIRPPASLPGAAMVTIRAEGAREVLVQAAAGGSTAPAVIAASVPGSPGLFQTPAWIWLDPAAALSVTIDGPRGRGTAVVPFSAAPAERRPMPLWTAILLAVLGLGLLAAAVAIVGGAVREATLDPEIPPQRKDHQRGRIAAGLTFFLLLAGLATGSWRWRTMDRDFRSNALARPQPVRASVETVGEGQLLGLTPATDQAFSGWDALAADHGKFVHLFLVRESDAGVFAHLHPVRRNSRRFETLLPPLPAGAYAAYADITHDDGRSETLVARVELPAAGPPVPQPGPPGDAWCQSPLTPVTDAQRPTTLDRDDAWREASPTHPRISPLEDGTQIVLQNARELRANLDATLRFAVVTPTGEAALLSPYMGMLGHCIVRRSDGTVFTHLHPSGTVSMAAQEIATAHEPASGSPSPLRPAREVQFPYAFPRPGEYRIWVQLCVGPRIVTGVFEVRVEPER